MKRVVTITFFTITLLISAKVFAAERCIFPSGTSGIYSSEEYKAFWESETDAQLMGQLFLKNFRRSGSDNLKLNMLCSSESMKEISRIRNRLFLIIENVVTKGSATDEEILAAEILTKAASADIAGLTLKEKSILKMINVLTLIDKYFSKKGFTGGALPQEVISLVMAGPAINMSGVSLSFRDADKKRAAENYELKINPGRDFETAHADYYSLFLYMKDDTGDSSFLNNKCLFPSCFTHSFTSYISIIQQRKDHQKEPDSIRDIRNYSSDIVKSLYLRQIHLLRRVQIFLLQASFFNSYVPDLNQAGISENIQSSFQNCIHGGFA